MFALINVKLADSVVDPGFGLVEIDQQLVLTPPTLSPCLPTISLQALVE